MASADPDPGTARVLSLAVAQDIVLGEMGCGDLIYELREQFGRIAAGDAVRVATRDPGAPADIPAWCRMTGRLLVAAAPPYYVIENRRRPEGAGDGTAERERRHGR